MFASKIDASAKRSGASVAWARRGVPLVEEARDQSPDAVLLDLGEPGAMDELRALRAERPSARVIGFVGHLRTDLVEEARALGVGEILTRGQLNARLDEVVLGASRVAS